MSAEEQSGTDQECLISCLRARAEAQSQLSMFDREIRLASPKPHKTADEPAARIARIEVKSAIDQRDHRIEVFAENSERHRGIGQNPRVVRRRLDGPASKVYPLRPEHVPIRGVEVRD